MIRLALCFIFYDTGLNKGGIAGCVTHLYVLFCPGLFCEWLVVSLTYIHLSLLTTHHSTVQECQTVKKLMAHFIIPITGSLQSN
jgi:hypothetical protein